jgi:hypothetical protein
LVMKCRGQRHFVDTNISPFNDVSGEYFIEKSITVNIANRILNK